MLSLGLTLKKKIIALFLFTLDTAFQHCFWNESCIFCALKYLKAKKTKQKRKCNSFEKPPDGAAVSLLLHPCVLLKLWLLDYTRCKAIHHERCA